MRTCLPLALLLFACTKEDVTNDGPPQPADVIAVASVASFTGAVGRFQQYAEALRPGAGAMVAAQLTGAMVGSAVGAENVDGIAFDQPLHLIILDPRKHPQPIVLLAHADPARLHPGGDVTSRAEGGAVLLGNKVAVDLCAAWAFGSLIKEKAPASPTIRASLRDLVERYGADIDKAVGSAGELLSTQSPGVGRVIQMELDWVKRLARHTEQIHLAVDAAAGEAWFEIGLTPTAGSLFDSFTRAQQPAAIGLIPRLSGTSRANSLMAGKYRLGPVRKVMFELAGEWMAQWAGVKLDAEFEKRWNAFLDHFQGSMAGSMGDAGGVGLTLQQVTEVDDGPATVAAAKALFSNPGPHTVDMFGLAKATITMQNGVATHDGVSIDEMNMQLDFAGFPPAQQSIMQAMYGNEMRVHYAGFDKYFVLTMGKTAPEDMQRTIDLVRRGPDAALPAGAKAALDGAVGRKATFMMFMNLASSMAVLTGRTVPATSGINMEVSFPDGKALMRIGVPAAHVRDIQSVFAPPN
jgi:hypothetical protein